MWGLRVKEIGTILEHLEGGTEGESNSDVISITWS